MDAPGQVDWDMALRGAVAAWLLAQAAVLVVPGPQAARRLALAGFALAVAGYVFCQRPAVLLTLPRPAAYAVLTLCVGAGGWMWVAARALFDDRFRWTPATVATLLALVVLGLAANLPYFPDGAGPFRALPEDHVARALERLHQAALLGLQLAALWVVLRDWRSDLVASRRLARRWAAAGVALYAVASLAVELALRGRDVGPLLPSLHLATIGLMALAVGTWVAHRSLDDLLGRTAVDGAATLPVEPPPPPQPATAPLPERVTQQLARLEQAMSGERLYRREGLTLAALAQALGMGEAALRELINQRLGFRNFNDFLHHHRLREAAERLQREDLPVLTIALDCGYGSIGPFNRAFRQRLGVTPTAYRAAARLKREPA
ncbi:MAG: helix-turn-helix transcriptional regulator [Rubrivivax sp.]